MPRILTLRFIASIIVPLFALSFLFLSQRSPLSVRSPVYDPAAPVHEQSASPSHAATMSTVRRAAPLIFPAQSRHTATVIFAHGLGDSGAGWADAVEHWRRRQKLTHVKFVLPNAPAIPISVNGGFRMPGWFDIKSLGPEKTSLEAKAEDEDEPGVLQTSTYFHSLIQDEIAAGISSERIILGGFSQGGAMSIFAGLTGPVKIGGIVGLSSWLLLSQTFKDRVPAENLNKATPIFMGHGDRDPMVRYVLAQGSEKLLKQLDFDVAFKTYSGMEHSACLEELDDVEAFMVSRIPNESS